MGFDRLNVMQEKMLETAISGQNVLLLSPTGSGKTVAFLIPLLAQPTRTLIIVPSRELAQQIGEVAKRLGLRSVLCYGGHDVRIENQRLEALANASSYVIIGTSGRLKDHIERKHINPALFTHLVLDEYDKSLELGFEAEIRFIITRMTNRQQAFLTSATHATPIAPWLNFTPYEKISPLDSPRNGGKTHAAETRSESDSRSLPKSWNGDLYQVKSPIADKLDTLQELLKAILLQDKAGSIIIFSGFRESSERIAHYLQDQGMECALYHGGLPQDLRDKAMIRLRSNTVRIMSATDLAARGLDIPEVAHIVHYHLPADIETYTHRCGRTARNGASGTAYFIVGPAEFLPDFIDSSIPVFNFKQQKAKVSKEQRDASSRDLTLVYIGRGKKEKISKGDILGFFTKNGGIDGSQIGRIDIMEHCSYCAIATAVVDEVLNRVKGLKIKGEKTIYKIVTTN